MIKKLLLLCFLLQCTISYAETIKTDVLVIGGGAAGVAAAIQSSRSNLKTMLVEQGPWLGGSMTSGGFCILDANRNVKTGIWAEFRKHVVNFYKKTPGYDTTQNAVLRFEPYTGAAILKKITDTVKRLTVKLNTPFTSVKKDGTGWEVEITVDNKPVTIKARVLIDGTETADVATMAGAVFSTGTDSRAATGESLAPETATDQIQNISFLAILKDNGRAADRTIKKPEGYNPETYSCLKGIDIKKLLNDSKILNDKYLLNCCANQYPVTADALKPENRAATFAKARLHTLGMVYYLQTVLGYKNMSLEEYLTADHLPYMPIIREYKKAKGIIQLTLSDIYTPYDRPTKLYRTAIAVADALQTQAYGANGAIVNYPPLPAYTIPLGAIVAANQSNLLLTEKALSVTHLVNASTADPAVQMTLGQGVGATAAYLAFFKTDTKNLNVRIIQGEVLDHKGYIFPLADVAFDDPYFRSIQQICVTGLLKGIQKVNGNSAQIYFGPDAPVNTEDIKPILTETYTRTFLWFNKNKTAEKFTLGNLLSFICEITLNDPETFQATLQKTWKTKYKFKTDFDVNRPVTRYEFAALTNKFLNPFARKVDITGRVIN
ncbi:FAD-dependent oxidoreductase [Mucilaginibacter gynuensis]|uniref:FAD-dependent oxidoreductase n=1 Tax=Mucilaginibacter gynuensis TaxID=1302236 RepID=A0ABP8GSY6_9SPHI